MAEEISERRKLEDLDKQLTKLLGSSYYGITQKRQVENVKFISSGCYSLDKVIGGGIPEGRLIELFGPESTAKSLLALNIVASFQKQGKTCAWLDVESCFSPEFATACGVDTDQLAIVKDCDYAEYYLEALRLIIKSGSINLIVLDSVASLVPKEITEKAVDESTMAVLARYTSKLLPELCALMSKNKVTVIFINQLRATLKSYGQPDDTPGGKAIKYYSSVRIRTSRKDVLKKNGEEVGVVIGVKAAKNKCGNPFGERQISAYFPHMEGDTIIAGIDLVGDLVDAAFEEGIITGSKAWMEYPAGNKINGREKMISYLKENQHILNQVKQDLLNNDSTTTSQTEESLHEEDTDSEE